MNRARVEQIANAVLYEGYLLYPYRMSSVKNKRRFNFGVLAPSAFVEAEGGSERSEMRTECLVCGGPETRLDIVVRFLQITGTEGGCQKAIEREVLIGDCSPEVLTLASRSEGFTFDAEGISIAGAVQVDARSLEPGLYRVSARVVNTTPLERTEEITRDEMLPSSLVSTHMLLFARGGEFVSLLEPPEHWRQHAAGCRNEATWPVLAGSPGERDAMLSSPIILYDYPQIAEESPGDLFDGTEIDEILSLRILTLTDEEKQEMRSGDDRAREILERTELLDEEHFMKLHGVLRGLRPAGEPK